MHQDYLDIISQICSVNALRLLKRADLLDKLAEKDKVLYFKVMNLLREECDKRKTELRELITKKE